MKKVPAEGFTLVDLMALAHERAVYIHIGVAGPDIAKIPAEVTVQFSKAGKDPVAYSFVMDAKNQRLNLGVSVQLLSRLNEYAPRQARLIVEK